MPESTADKAAVLVKTQDFYIKASRRRCFFDSEAFGRSRSFSIALKGGAFSLESQLPLISLSSISVAPVQQRRNLCIYKKCVLSGEEIFAQMLTQRSID